MAYRPKTRIWTPAPLTVSAVLLSDLKSHLRRTDSAEDALITSYGIAATAQVEHSTQRALMPRAAVLSLECLPTGKTPIELPGGAISSLTSMFADGVEITGLSVIGHSPALLIPSADWPTVTGDGYAVTITYQVGFAEVPFDLQHAVKIFVGEMNKNRENSFEGSLATVPVSAEYLMKSHRIGPAA
jgi:uncharacterized phiE125 gp8 family phage protein